jgi:Zn-dependent M28 family amino/carboxypeptidase
MSAAYAFSLMKPGPRTIVFQWYTAEESGLIGSGYYVNNPTFPKGNPDIDDHIAMINLDMVGRYRFGHVYSQKLGEHEIQWLELGADWDDYIDRLEDDYPFADDLTRTSGSASDHARFRNAGVPAVWLFTGSHNDYHTRRDTADKINYEDMVRVAKYCIELAYLCVNEGYGGERLPIMKMDAEDLKYDHGGAEFLP